MRGIITLDPDRRLVVYQYPAPIGSCQEDGLSAPEEAEGFHGGAEPAD